MNGDNRYKNLFELERYGYISRSDRIVCPNCGTEYGMYTSDEILDLDNECTVELDYKCEYCLSKFKLRVILEYEPSYTITSYKQEGH